jgi:release factor glutamine methyltransferase
VANLEELLRQGVERLREAGSETARLDAELLLGHAIGVERTVVIAHPEWTVSDAAAERFENALERRSKGEPVAYIRGFKEFHGLAFATDPRAMIPRPETELLVDLAEGEILHRLTATPRPPGTPRLRVADVGTGGGTIGIALAAALRRRHALDDVEIIGTDMSPDALDLARENAVGHAVGDRVRFIEADVLPPVVDPPFDVVLANLPSIPSGTIPSLPVAASFEPRASLDGGPDGLAAIRVLVGRLPSALAPAGTAMLEVGSDQADAVREIVAAELPDWGTTVEPDLSGAPRVVRIDRP